MAVGACPLFSGGCVFAYDADGANPYTTVAGVKSATGPNLSVELKETQDLADAWKTRCASIKDGGSMTWQVKMTSDAYALFLNTLFGEIYYYRITFPLGDGESTPCRVDMQAILDQIGLEIPEGNDQIMVPIQITVTGPVTFTEAA